MGVLAGNLGEGLKADSDEEIFETIARISGARIERITSFGQASPEGFFYNQDFDEWVCVIRGRASIRIEDEVRELDVGDWVFLPKGLKHRVEETAHPTVWLAISSEPA